MRKKIVILIFLNLAIINAAIAGLWISGIGRKTEILTMGLDNTKKVDSHLFDSSSLNITILKLKKRLSAIKAIKRKDYDYNTLEMTEEVLLLLEKNKIKVISYRLEGEKNREELVITAEGKTGSLLKFIYELSFSEEGFCINFVSVDARFSGRPAILIIRIIYA